MTKDAGSKSLQNLSFLWWNIFLITNKNMGKVSYRFSPFHWTKICSKSIIKVLQKCSQRYSTVKAIDFEPVFIRGNCRKKKEVCH